MKKFYNSPAVLIKEYEISEDIAVITTSGKDNEVDDGFVDFGDMNG